MRVLWATRHKELFPATRLSAGYGFRKETLAATRRNGRGAPEPAVPMGLTMIGRFDPFPWYFRGRGDFSKSSTSPLRNIPWCGGEVKAK